MVAATTRTFSEPAGSNPSTSTALGGLVGNPRDGRIKKTAAGAARATSKVIADLGEKKADQEGDEVRPGKRRRTGGRDSVRPSRPADDYDNADEAETAEVLLSALFPPAEPENDHSEPIEYIYRPPTVLPNAYGYRSPEDRRQIERLQGDIYYADRYSDDTWEYRHVILPKKLLQYVPDSYKNRILSEAEWRALGITQSPGWHHYMLHNPEPHVFLFRREVNFATRFTVVVTHDPMAVVGPVYKKMDGLQKVGGMVGTREENEDEAEEEEGQGEDEDEDPSESVHDVPDSDADDEPALVDGNADEDEESNEADQDAEEDLTHIGVITTCHLSSSADLPASEADRTRRTSRRSAQQAAGRIAAQYEIGPNGGRCRSSVATSSRAGSRRPSQEGAGADSASADVVAKPRERKKAGGGATGQAAAQNGAAVTRRVSGRLNSGKASSESGNDTRKTKDGARKSGRSSG